MSKKTLLAVGASGVLALGIAVPAVAWATEGKQASSQATNPGRSDEHQQKLAEALAKELGIDQTKVADALKKVNEQLRAQAQANRPARPEGTDKADHLAQLKTRLDEAVKAGKLTQVEADAIAKAAEAGLLNGHGPGGGRGPKPGAAPAK